MTFSIIFNIVLLSLSYESAQNNETIQQERKREIQSTQKVAAIINDKKEKQDER